MEKKNIQQMFEKRIYQVSLKGFNWNADTYTILIWWSFNKFFLNVFLQIKINISIRWKKDTTPIESSYFLYI